MVADPAVYAQTKATKGEIASAFVGKNVRFDYGATVSYGADGSYQYADSARNQFSRGTYTINDGQICVKFTNGASRCDDILKDGNDFTLINKSGHSYRLTFF